MRIIHVHLDAAQGSVVVVPDPEVVFEGDEIVWEIRAPGRAIAKVEFEIQQGAKKLRHSQKLQHERARLRFVAPKAKTKNKQPARYKYTVRGVHGSGAVLAEADPVIIVVPPE